MDEPVGNWYILGDSQSAEYPGDIKPWWELLQDKGLLTATVNAAGGRGLFYNGYDARLSCGTTWNVDDITTEDFVLIYLSSNDTNNTGFAQLEASLSLLIEDLEAQGYIKGFTLFHVTAIDGDYVNFEYPRELWDGGWVRTSERKVWGNLPGLWGANLTTTVDSVHRDQAGQWDLANEMYKLMLGAKRRFDKNGGVIIPPNPEGGPGDPGPEANAEHPLDFLFMNRDNSHR